MLRSNESLIKSQAQTVGHGELRQVDVPLPSPPCSLWIVQGYGCNVKQGQALLSQGALDVLVIVFGIRACILDFLVTFLTLFEMMSLIYNHLIKIY